VTGFAIDFDASDAQRKIGAMLKAVSDPADALDAIGFDVSQRADLTFDRQADPWNIAWAPLSPVTLALRRKGGKGAQILRDTGRLGASITHNVVGDEVRVGSNVQYSRAQQLGNPTNKMFGKGSAPIPARPFLPIRNGRAELPPDWARAALGILRDLVKEAGGVA
jgi:phage gpG-like protein